MTTEKDFEKFFGVAKAHHLSLSSCYELAEIQFGKRLNDLTPAELEVLAWKICQTDPTQSLDK
jgi:hypothetical protein